MLVLAIVLLAALLTLLAVHFQLRRRYAALLGELSRATAGAASSRYLLEQLRQKDSVKDEFISTVSHELRTPLTSIRGALGLLSSGVLGKLDDRAANLLRIASSNTDRLVRLINDILDLQRMDSGQAPLETRPCNVGQLLQHAVETMESMAIPAGVELILEANAATETLTIESDPDRMLQVLCNLLSNAVKFSPPRTPVYLRTAVERDVLVIQVEDGGRGVPDDKLEAIFDRFCQVEPSDARSKGGTGLGLAICRSIIAQHHGTIHAQRNDLMAPGRPGTTLVIRLPMPARNTSITASLHHLVA